MHISALNVGDRVKSRQNMFEYEGIVDYLGTHGGEVKITKVIGKGISKLFEAGGGLWSILIKDNGTVMCANGCSDQTTELEFLNNQIVCLVCKKWCDKCECGFCKTKRSSKTHKK